MASGLYFHHRIQPRSVKVRVRAGVRVMLALIQDGPNPDHKLTSTLTQP